MILQVRILYGRQVTLRFAKGFVVIFSYRPQLKSPKKTVITGGPFLDIVLVYPRLLELSWAHARLFFK